jgi:hypothetical protein
MENDLLSLLSNLGAIDQNRAVRESDLVASWAMNEDEKHSTMLTIQKLANMGYLERDNTDARRIYLSKTGLIRAMSNYS